MWITTMMMLQAGTSVSNEPGIYISAGAIGAIGTATAFILKQYFFPGNGNSKYVTKEMCSLQHKYTDETLGRIENKVDEILTHSGQGKNK